MVNLYYPRTCRRRCFRLTGPFIFGILILAFHTDFLSFRISQYTEINKAEYHVPVTIKLLNYSEGKTLNTSKVKLLNSSKEKPVHSYENFTQWNRSLCSIQSNLRGPNQKVIGISVYGTSSKYTDNAMFSWEKTIFPFLIPLADEVKLLLPSWIIRLYIDFSGSTKSQQDFLYNFSNIDICDIHNIPMFGSSLVSYLPGRMWRFLPIFDPFVDYFLSRDLDSPVMKRDTETIDMWLSDEQKKYFFLIARDHKQHGVPILAGLWGAAPARARHYLFYIFQSMLIPSIARQYTYTGGDQDFLAYIIWSNVKKHALIFDSYNCRKQSGRPFLSRRTLADNCFLGCIRPCCTNITSLIVYNRKYICPPLCRPRDHRGWIYC
ncbi:unnamed protein product [Rotaria sp. Silwood2]|nr:unnamed protein product [Rotaria sp. Silwood2]CAF4028439.1 unnamed protein product [Rotaria sp. Silwood2]